MTTLLDPDPIRVAEAWLEIDPDPVTRAQTASLLAVGGDGVAEHFGARLAFGTAGLRGKLGTGPNRINRVLVRLVAAALALKASEDPARHVVVGFDARHNSLHFARDTARVLAAHGLKCTLLPRPMPTPVLAFAVKELDASAGVMVTASHNPRDDNGYKVYWKGGAQLVAPLDREIGGLIDRTPLLREDDLAPLGHPNITEAKEDLVDSYVTAICGLLSSTSQRSTCIAYTPLHGVGAELLERAFHTAGFPAPVTVVAQREPDPDFPTTAFPNPEEPGTVDLVLELASRSDADLAIANDPDADRLAVAVPQESGWKLLSGDEVGCLLAEHLLSRPSEATARRLVINTVVSSRLLEAIATGHGAQHRETLTGFKWIMKCRSNYPEHEFILGYEEALGYAIDDVVHDKDGISAALVIAELAGDLAAEGRSLLDLLDDLHRRHGIHITGQRSVRFEPVMSGVPLIAQSMETLRAFPPSHLAGHKVSRVIDLAQGSESLPSTDGVVIEMEGARLVVRPSGTEPKMKVYCEVVAPPGADLAPRRVAARVQLKEILDDAVSMVANPHRSAPSSPGMATDDSALSVRAQELFNNVPVGADRATNLRKIIRCIDLTTLEGSDTPSRIRALCAEASRPDPADPTVGPAAAVCVYPSFVATARELTAGGPVRVASVAGAFPSGLSSLEVRLADITNAIDSGADEIDIVLNRSAFLDGRFDETAGDLRASRSAVGEALLKVILEVGDLASPAAIREATQMAIDAGADMVKTSTGKTPDNATPISVLIMARCVADHMEQTGTAIGIKVAGGVRTAQDALGYAAIIESVLGSEWLVPDRFRIGASSLLTDLVNELAIAEAQPS